ncbi:MAG TPA: NAD(P)/FAD-dependent oxidoreductase [Solirubrobacterales bacterium]|jgi:phytoene dehydrogenase-like protein|nr:NAD(P)/FAD-dependent oxidoreductase [Solirubrobacterales bacterium]
MSEAIVVGSGPNGLACAATLASRGVAVTVIEAEQRIGGGTRSSELTLPGLIHDECSAFHPMAVGSPAYTELALERHGLQWLWPEVDLAHPLDGGEGAAMLRSLEATAAGLGAAGPDWERLFGPSVRGYDALAGDIYRPLAHLPRHPLRLARFGLAALMPATVLARTLRTPQAKALFGGSAGHAFAPLGRPLSGAIAMALVSSGHRFGWPVARGGSAAIAAAFAAAIEAHGGRIETGRPVRSLDELPTADAVVLDLSPAAVLELAGGRLPARVARAYRRYRYGPAAFKLDLAVQGGIPWAYEPARRAGTVHAIGSLEELVVAEREIDRGRMPARPFVLVGQQYLADPGRSRGDLHPIWAYAQVPSRYGGDATEAVLDQIERFAPGLRERIVSQAVRTPAEIEARNANLIGGDIACGANTARQMLFRPRLGLDPYATGIPGVFICSAATPPGAGAHGICGYNAAQAVLRSF